VRLVGTDKIVGRGSSGPTVRGTAELALGDVGVGDVGKANFGAVVIFTRTLIVFGNCVIETLHKNSITAVDATCRKEGS